MRLRGFKDANMRNRHLVTGTMQTSSAVDKVRSRISQAYASIYKPGVNISLDEKLQPALVTKSLLKAKEPTIDDLMQLDGYHETSVGPCIPSLKRKQA